MQVMVETNDGLERKMRVTVPSDQVELRISEKIRQTAKDVRLKGFRPGKVPLREVKRRFGEGIRHEVSNDMIQSTYGEALLREEINPAGMPKIEGVRIEEGQDLEYTAIFEVFPEVTVSSFESIELEKLISEVDEPDIDKMIDTLREQRIDYQEAGRASQEKDKINLDFEGFVDNEGFEGGKAEGADVVLGSGSMVPGFEEGIVGLTVGEEKDLEITFPHDYQAENLAGKDAVFKIKINSVSQPNLPELNDDFFKMFDVEDGGYETFRDEVRKNMERELDAVITAKIKERVMNGLDETNEVVLPQALLNQEIDRLRQETLQQFGGEGASQIDPSLLPSEMFSERAAKRVKLGLLVNAIVEQNEVKPDDVRVKTMIDTLANSYEDPEQVKNFYFSNEQQLKQIESMVVEEQIVDLIMESAQVTEKKVSYEEGVRREPASIEKEPEANDGEVLGENEEPGGTIDDNEKA